MNLHSLSAAQERRAWNASTNSWIRIPQKGTDPLWLLQCNWEDFKRVEACPTNALTASRYSLA
jgi:hypothetical protein